MKCEIGKSKGCLCSDEFGFCRIKSCLENHENLKEWLKLKGLDSNIEDVDINKIELP